MAQIIDIQTSDPEFAMKESAYTLNWRPVGRDALSTERDPHAYKSESKPIA